MSQWGPFQNEKEFNFWLRGKGHSLLVSELKILLGMNMERVDKNCGIFGIPDNLFYSHERKVLIFVECATELTKKHLGKDLLYSIASFPGVKINTVTYVWILASHPSNRMVEMISQIFSKLYVERFKLQFYLATPVVISDSDFRLNIELAFGERSVPMNGKQVKVTFAGIKDSLSIRSFAQALGLPYTTAIVLARRWKAEMVGNKISGESLGRIVRQVEEKATGETGIDFCGKFVPVFAKTEEMLFSAEACRILRLKGTKVRANIMPRWITISGSSTRGYRLLYEKKELEAYLEKKHRRSLQHRLNFGLGTLQ